MDFGHFLPCKIIYELYVEHKIFGCAFSIKITSYYYLYYAKPRQLYSLIWILEPQEIFEIK